MASSRKFHTVVFTLLMLSASLSGCFGNEESGVDDFSSSVELTPTTLIGGVLQVVSFSSSEDVSVFVPYLFKQSDTGLFQNGTVINIEDGDSVELEILVPPRTDTLYLLVGKYGRDNFPLRMANESWTDWYLRGGHENPQNTSIST